MQNMIEKPQMKVTFDISGLDGKFSQEDLKNIFVSGINSWANSLQSLIDSSKSQKDIDYYNKITKSRNSMKEKIMQFTTEQNNNDVVAFVLDVNAITGITSILTANFWQEKYLQDFSPDELLYHDFIDGFGNEIMAHMIRHHMDQCLETGKFSSLPEMNVVLVQ